MTNIYIKLAAPLPEGKKDFFVEFIQDGSRVSLQKIDVQGQETAFVELLPGKYIVKAYFTHNGSNSGIARVELTVSVDQCFYIEYRPPESILPMGKITAEHMNAEDVKDEMRKGCKETHKGINILRTEPQGNVEEDSQNGIAVNADYKIVKQIEKNLEKCIHCTTTDAIIVFANKICEDRDFYANQQERLQNNTLTDDAKLRIYKNVAGYKCVSVEDVLQNIGNSFNSTIGETISFIDSIWQCYLGINSNISLLISAEQNESITDKLLDKSAEFLLNEQCAVGESEKKETIVALIGELNQKKEELYNDIKKYEDEADKSKHGKAAAGASVGVAFGGFVGALIGGAVGAVADFLTTTSINDIMYKYNGLLECHDKLFEITANQLYDFVLNECFGWSWQLVFEEISEGQVSLFNEMIDSFCKNGIALEKVNQYLITWIEKFNNKE